MGEKAKRGSAPALSLFPVVAPGSNRFAPSPSSMGIPGFLAALIRWLASTANHKIQNHKLGLRSRPSSLE